MKPKCKVLYVAERTLGPVSDSQTEIHGGFCDLFDECARAVFSRGLDLDDVIMEKEVVRGRTGEENGTPLRLIVRVLLEIPESPGSR